jgi:serine/threonine protein kinase
MIVMEYAEDGSLRNNLKNNIYYWDDIHSTLYSIISGLKSIHDSNIVHCDLHDGNILCNESILYVSDLGLCKPIDYFKNKTNNDVYGVLPYVAPEVLRGNPYSLASDIYSFAMIMWELTSGVPPFNDRPHDFQLALDICKGERPDIIEGTPQCYVDLMKKCWDSDPLKRPKNGRS